ncbi:MAG: ribonuclease III [Candidatus Acidiferrales bacterium]
MTPQERNELEAVLGHHFQHPEELDRALTHRSHRQTSHGTDNERLEFLGDRVLGLIASERLCRTFPDWDSGKLSKGLARVVNATSLHSAAKKLQLGHYLRLGPGEEKTGGRDKKRLLADAYEAILAAIYLDAGLAAVASFLQRTLLDPALADHSAALGRPDHKSALQEWLQQRARGSVEYRIRSESGPEHQKVFEVEVWHAGERLSSSCGRSKKEAEQEAASAALEILEARGAALKPSA